jgi:hypothetical protein
MPDGDRMQTQSDDFDVTEEARESILLHVLTNLSQGIFEQDLPGK